MPPRHRNRGLRRFAGSWLALAALAFVLPVRAVILWSDLGSTLAHNTGKGADLLHGGVKRDDTAGDTLYFKFHIDPLSDTRTEEYLAAFQLFVGPKEGLGIGNSLKAWAYSAFNTAVVGEFNKVAGDLDLNSARPESSGVGTFFPYELPRRGVESTIVFKVEYVPGGDDHVTVWLNPDLAPGATEANQSAGARISFSADASFDQVRLRHEGGGGGWVFSDMRIATTFADLVNGGGATMGETARDVARFSFRSWQRSDGLPQNAVRALAQTPDGYLWIGSDDGVTRFDGVRFVSFGTREGLRVNRVRTLFADARGALWIGTENAGLACFAEGGFSTVTAKDGLRSDAVNAFAQDAEQRLWVGTEGGLSVLNQSQPVALGGAAEFEHAPVQTLFRDRDGVMWIGARGIGVFSWSQGQSQRVIEPSLDDLLRDPHALLVDRAGRLWIGAGDDFVLCREGREWRRYRIPRHLARPFVTALAEQPDGSIWAGSVSEGLFHFKEGRLEAVNASSGLSESAVEALLVDHDGRLWVGTGAGLDRLQPQVVTPYGPGEGLGYGAVNGLAEVAPGVIWAVKPEDGIYQWSGREGRGFDRLNTTAALGRDAQVRALLAPVDGSCWLGSERGLGRVKEPITAPELVEHALPVTNAVTALAEASAGEIWAGTGQGELWVLRNTGWARGPQLSGSNAISAIVGGRDGKLWVGTAGSGLVLLRGNESRRWSKIDGLLSDNIRTLCVETNDTVWIGTAGGGLSRWRDGRLVSFSLREGLPDSTISQILEDDKQRLWLGNNRGIACVSKRDLEDLASGRSTMLFPQVFDRRDGMLSDECVGGFFPAGLKTQSGLLCFPTLKGIAVVDPRLQKPDLRPPRVLIEEVVLDDDVLGGNLLAGAARTADGQSPRPALRIPPGNHRIEFHYTGLSFTAPERVRFRYRLEGLDANWLEAGTRRTAFFTYLPPGEYRFHVEACNADGVWSEDGPSVAFTVLPHLWQAWWFVGLTGVALILAVAGTVRVVEKRKHQNRLKLIERERAVERERARIAQDLHDDLGSSLARISLLSGLAKDDKEHPQQVLAHVTKIAQSANDTVRALEEIVWAVRPGSDTLQSLVEYIAHFSNELFEGNGTRCRLDLPHDLPALTLAPEIRHNMFLVVKEALTNVLKHAKAHEVRVQAKAAAHTLEILVQDDGRGFDPTKLPTGRNGLTNMRQRAEAMGGTLTVESRPNGTVVRLVVATAGGAVVAPE